VASQLSARAVGGRPVLDSQDDDEALGLIDLVDDAVHAAPGRSHSGQFTLQFAAETVGVVEQRSEHELDDRRGGAFGKSVPRSASRAARAPAGAR
jgi:hypothetical protein